MKNPVLESKLAPAGSGLVELLTVSPVSVSLAFTVKDIANPVLLDIPGEACSDRELVCGGKSPIKIDRVEMTDCC